MAIKGKGYTKTTWAFQERPVASSKLNLWDDRLETALELLHFLSAHAWGGGDGVVRGAAADDLSVKAANPASLAVEVQPGYGFITKFAYKLDQATTTVDVVAPTTDPRKDLVQARLGTWDVSIKTGTENASPVAPTADVDAIPLAELYLRTGMTVIKDTDDSTNGYIIDVRIFL